MSRIKLIHWIPVLLVVAPLSGCVTDGQMSCDKHEARVKTIKPVTTYALAPGNPTIRTLSAGAPPQAPTYVMKFVPGFTKPCTIISIRKEVVILRSLDRNLNFSETRKFFAEDGTLITSTTQNITDQVARSGKYIATTPLPIPRNAPPGKYKIVSELQADRRGDRRLMPLARTEGYFYIIPPQ